VTNRLRKTLIINLRLRIDAIRSLNFFAKLQQNLISPVASEPH
jgi:hypothetical protein